MYNKLNQRGGVNPLLLSLIIVSIFFIASASFAVWAYSGRQDYKDNVESKIADATAENTRQVQAEDAKTYAETAKNPFKTYVGPDSFGSIKVTYPKTWSAYVDTKSNPVDAYFHTDYVPAVTDQNAIYNLRVQILDSSYDTAVKQYQGNVKSGKATATPYKLAKVANVSGIRFDGQLFGKDGTGSIVMMPIRDKTLVLWAQSDAYLADFNNIILPNVTFSP